MSESAGNVVALHDVRLRYQRRGRWVLDGLDLVVSPGSLTVIAGPNGSGKSTLLRTLAGLTRVTSGTVERRAASVAFAPERLSSTLRMSADVYLRHVARLRGLGEIESRRRIAQLCDRFALEPGRDAQIRTLSKGNSQKVAIIQGLLSPVDLLVLDEPHTGLDVSSRAMLDQMLTERADAGAAVVLTSHHNDAFGTRRFDLLDGRLTAHDRPPAHPAPQTVQIDLGSTPDSVSLAFADMPGVRAVTDVTPHGLTVIADRTITDRLLADALLARWSVTSVRPIEVE